MAMENLADQCVDLERLLRAGNTRRARAWLVGAVDMVDAALAVRLNTKRTLRDALKHLATSDDVAALIPGDEDDDLLSGPDADSDVGDADAGSDAGSDADGGAGGDNLAMELPEDDDAPFGMPPIAPADNVDMPDVVAVDGDAVQDAADASASEPQPQPGLTAPLDATTKKATRRVRPTLGNLGALILSTTAVALGRSEDSIPFSAITDSIESAKKAAADAHTKAKEADRVVTALVDAEKQLRTSRAASQASGIASEGGATPAKASAAAGASDSTPSGQVGTKGNAKGSTAKSAASAGASHHKKTLAAAAVGTKGLASFGFTKKESTVTKQIPPSEAPLFTPFIQGNERKTSNRLRLWPEVPLMQQDSEAKEEVPAAGSAVEVKKDDAPPSLMAKLRRNELDVSGLGTPRNFNAEVTFVMWTHENYSRSETRPPFLGTWNSALNTTRLGRPAEMKRSDGPAAEAFAMPRAAGVEYDEDSGDDWDDEGDGTDIGGESARSSESELDSDEREFFAGDDEDDSAEGVEEREENKIQRAERLELEQQRRRRHADLEPRYDGVFDGLPLSKHPLKHADQLVYAHQSIQVAINEGHEYLRIARMIFDQAGVDIPEELLSEAEKAAAEAKKARLEAKAARAAAGTTVRRVKKTKTPKDGAAEVVALPAEGAVAAPQDGDAAAVATEGGATATIKPETEVTSKLRSRKKKNAPAAGTLTLDAVMAAKRNTPKKTTPTAAAVVDSGFGDVAPAPPASDAAEKVEAGAKRSRSPAASGDGNACVPATAGTPIQQEAPQQPSAESVLPAVADSLDAAPDTSATAEATL